MIVSLAAVAALFGLYLFVSLGAAALYGLAHQVRPRETLRIVLAHRGYAVITGFLLVSLLLTVFTGPPPSAAPASTQRPKGMLSVNAVGALQAGVRWSGVRWSAAAFYPLDLKGKVYTPRPYDDGTFKATLDHVSGDPKNWARPTRMTYSCRTNNCIRPHAARVIWRDGHCTEQGRQTVRVAGRSGWAKLDQRKFFGFRPLRFECRPHVYVTFYDSQGRYLGGGVANW